MPCSPPWPQWPVLMDIFCGVSGERGVDAPEDRRGGGGCRCGVHVDRQWVALTLEWLCHAGGILKRAVASMKFARGVTISGVPSRVSNVRLLSFTTSDRRQTLNRL